MGNRHPRPTMTGFEPLIGAAAAGLGGLITGLVKDKGTETLKKLDWDIGKNLALKKALVDYVRRYIDRHGTLKVACVRMDYPVRLDEIYTAVQLLDRSALRYFESEDALQMQYRESGKRGFNVTRAEKKPGLQVANEQQYLMVLGGPGVGKSTFLRKVGLEALRTLGRRDFAGKDPGNLLVPQKIFYQHPRIPVMLELRQFDKPNLSIKDLIAHELNICGFPEAEELTELFLQNGQLLVLLDGLDEVPASNLNHVISEIENLVIRYKSEEDVLSDKTNREQRRRKHEELAKSHNQSKIGNRFIASCRIAAYNSGGFTQFKDVVMAAFEDSQIKQFISNWFRKERDLESNTANRCWQLISGNDYSSAKELAQTPLLLTLLCVVYEEYQDFPKKRHSLYGEALDVLLRKWASEKRIHHHPIYQDLSTELELDMLAEIAYNSFADDQLFFPKERLIDQIREFLIENLNAPPYLDAETALKEIEIQQGILVERARNTYSFSHLTFQEYLTAKCIVDNQKTEMLIANHIKDNHWREVFLLTAGLAPGKRGADNLLIAIERKAQSCISQPKNKLLLDWSQDVTNKSKGTAKPFKKRVAAIFFVLNLIHAYYTAADSLNISDTLNSIQIFSFSCEINLNRDLTIALSRSLDLDLILLYVKECQNSGNFGDCRFDLIAREINLTQIDDSSYEACKRSTKNIIAIFLRYLGLDMNVIEISEKEAKSLSEYFYTLELMVRCKEAAVRVSPQVWEGIESRMVTVPSD